MDPQVAALLALVAAALGGLGGFALARMRLLDRVQRATGSATPEEAGQVLEAVRAEEDEAKRHAIELRRELESVIELDTTGIVRVDSSQVITFANQAAHALMRRPAGSMTGRRAIEAFADRRFEELIDRAISGGTATGEMVVNAGKGSPTVVVRARRATGDSAERAAGAWLVLQDVTELRRLQRIRAEFIDNLSHELRTPVTTIRLLTETLTDEAERTGASQRMRDRIAKVDVETGHLAQMVSEILDLAQIESGGQISLHDDVDLGRVAASSVDRLQLFAERQGVHLSAEVEPRLPLVRGDGNRLGQVFVNLLHNAVKFSPNGGEVIARVRFEPDAEGGPGRLLAEVEDHGVGIPRAEIERIFERFYKVDRARTRSGGTGLGLAIAKHIVEGHGGRIWAESEEGSGSRFRFVIPLPPEEDAVSAEPGGAAG